MVTWDAYGDVPTTLTKVRKTTFKQATNGIIKLFEYIVTLFEGLKPELYIDREFTFEHKGKLTMYPVYNRPSKYKYD